MRHIPLLVPLAWRSLWRNPRRTLITLMIVAVGMWAILTFSALLAAWADSTRTATLRLLTGSGQIHASGYLDEPSIDNRMSPPSGPLLASLGRPPITAWTVRLRAPAIIQSEYRSLPVVFLGVDPRSERVVSDIPREIETGRYLEDSNDPSIVLGRHLLVRLKTRVGKRVVLMMRAADGHLAEQSFQVVGAFSGPLGAQDQYAFTGLKAAQSFAGVGREISEISFSTPKDTDLTAVIRALRKAAPNLDVEDWRSIAPFAYTMTQLAAGNVSMIFTIMVALIAIGIVNAQLMAVFERTREFGLLQALGMRPRLIVLHIAMESGLLIGMGVAAGGVLAWLTLLSFPSGLDLGALASGAERLGAGRVLHLSIDGRAAVAMAGLVWVLGMAAALWPARRATRIDPIKAMATI